MASDSRKYVSGVGINDSKIPITNNKAYITWASMLDRCYGISAEYCGHAVICDDWILFSNFERWMYGQQWEGKYLDKDILFPGNVMYSPETCVFVDGWLNSRIKTMWKKRELPLGVDRIKRKDSVSYSSKITIDGERIKLGEFSSINAAAIIYLKVKNRSILAIMRKVDSQKIKKGLYRHIMRNKAEIVFRKASIVCSPPLVNK